MPGINTPQPPENDIHNADTRHPVDHIETLPRGGDDSNGRIYEVLGRTFEWVAEADDASEKGLGAAVVLYCVRSDLVGRENLEDLAFSLHYKVLQWTGSPIIEHKAEVSGGL